MGFSKGASLGPPVYGAERCRSSRQRALLVSIRATMAKWFKEFPINLKNGTDRIRSASESGSQPRAGKPGLVASIGTKTPGSKTGHRKNSSSDSTGGGGGGGGGGGVGSLLSGRNRKNSATEVSRNGVSAPKDGKVWDSLLSGKSRKNSKAEPAEPVFEEQQQQHRPLKSSPSANSYISRLIRVDKQDKSPNFNCGTVTGPVPVPEAEKPAQCKTETVSKHKLRLGHVEAHTKLLSHLSLCVNLSKPDFMIAVL